MPNGIRRRVSRELRRKVDVGKAFRREPRPVTPGKEVLRGIQERARLKEEIARAKERGRAMARSREERAMKIRRARAKAAKFVRSRAGQQIAGVPRQFQVTRKRKKRRREPRRQDAFAGIYNPFG